MLQKRYFVVLIWTVLFLGFKRACAQSEIAFDTSSCWKSALKKAKLQEKLIFVDFYTTWCGPCKMMDRDVYTNERIASFANSNFICLKIQCDSTGLDSDLVKAWYKDMKTLTEKHNIQAFPSFLFFNGMGEIVHRAVGFRDSSQFVCLLVNALDTSKQCYTLLAESVSGILPFNRMPKLANYLKDNGDKHSAGVIARLYFEKFMRKADDSILYNKDNLGFVGPFAVDNKISDALDFYYLNRQKINSIMGNPYADLITQLGIIKWEIKPVVDSMLRNGAGAPNWKGLHNKIRMKYNSYFAEKTILDEKIRWYESHSDWQPLVDCNVEKIEKYGLDTVGLSWVFTSNMLYNVIFKHSNNKRILKEAAAWMSIICSSHPDDGALLDTYANLQYKMGERHDALLNEKKAFSLDPNNKEITSNLSLMKEGRPTWD